MPQRPVAETDSGCRRQRSSSRTYVPLRFGSRRSTVPLSGMQRATAQTPLRERCHGPRGARAAWGAAGQSGLSVGPQEADIGHWAAQQWVATPPHHRRRRRCRRSAAEVRGSGDLRVTAVPSLKTVPSAAISHYRRRQRFDVVSLFVNLACALPDGPDSKTTRRAWAGCRKDVCAGRVCLETHSRVSLVCPLIAEGDYFGTGRAVVGGRTMRLIRPVRLRLLSA